MVDIDEMIRPDLAAEQVHAGTEQSKTNRFYALNDFLKVRVTFPGTEDKPDLESEKLYKNTFDMVLMAAAELALDTQDWVQRERRERGEK